MKNIVILISFLFACSCQYKNRQMPENKGIVVDLDVYEDKNFKASDIFKNCRTIILETKIECLIGNISDIQVYDGKIFIHDKTIGKSLLVFDMNGKFICRIGNFGRGPGEYSNINDATIDQDNKVVYVLDSHRKILLKYSLEGEYISSVSIKEDNVSFRSIQYFDGKIYASIQHTKKNDDNLLKLIDPVSGKVIKGYLTMEDNKGWNGAESEYGFFHRAHRTPRYTRSFMNYIFSLENMTIPHVTFESKNFANRTLVDEIKTKNVIEQKSTLLRTRKIYGIQNFIETKDFIFFQFDHGQTSTGLYRKYEETTTIGFFKNDLLYKTGCLLTPRCTDDKGAYEAVAMDQFLLYYKDLLLDDVDKRDQLLALDENSNPIIFYYEFKDN